MARQKVTGTDRAELFTGLEGVIRSGMRFVPFLILFLSATARAQVDTAWVRRWTGVGSYTDLIYSVATDRWGNVIGAGYAIGEMTAQDILVVKYAPDGTLIWVRRYDWRGLNDVASGVVVDQNGNIYVSGYSADSLTSSDYLTLSYDPDGNLRWTDRYNGPGSSSDITSGIALDSSGNVYVTGYSYSNTTYDDFCTIKYNANGARLWVTRYSGASTERAQAIATDLSGNVYVTGYTQAGNDMLTIKYNTNGVQQWLDRYNGEGNGADYATAVCTDRLGNCYVTGYSLGTGTADYDYVTIKYSTSGTREWVARYNGDGNDNDYPYGVITDRNGDVYVTGYGTGLNTVYDVVTIRYNTLGQQVWVRRYDTGNNNEYGRAIALDSRGNIYITGSLVRGSNYDFLTISYSPDGNLRWEATYAGPGNGMDYSLGLILDAWGNVFVGGVSYGGSQTGNDALIIKYIQPDVAALRVLFPTGTIDTATAIQPWVEVANRGSAPTGLKVYCAIYRAGGSRFYLDSLIVIGLGPGESTQVTFTEWLKPHPLGSYVVRCSTYRAFDQNLNNNVVQAEFQITAGPYGWMEMPPVPCGPSGRQVKDGGALAFCEAENRIYAIKGNRSGDFYFYQPNLRSWVTLAVIPVGPNGKLPGKGARLATDNQGNVYLVRGNNTREFWRFNADSGWVQLEDIPAGISGKAVKGGSDMVFVEADECIYLLKGYKNEFYRFRISSGTWEELEPAPPAGKTKWDKGSFIVYDNAGSIYACRAKYNDLWRYDIGAGSWDTLHLLRGMPFQGKSGRSTKLKDGGCGAYFNGSIYALKGSNTSEFWRYDIAGDSWVEIDTIPSQGTTGKKKRVKAGADIVYGGDAFYAFKGNKTLEFWRYALPPGDIRTGAMSPGVVKSAAVLPVKAGLISQNRFWIEMPGAGNGQAELVLFDPAGRVVQRGVCRFDAGRAVFSPGRLNSGVYYLRLRGPGFAGTGKLVIGR
uniref:CARDB domain-containing protein n=1 Tax=candidate division WOR-3 bacterium TaxID=2052148 RepID=A0A7C3EML1_UNCW3